MSKESMANHISWKQSFHARLATMNSPIEESMKIAILISSSSNVNEYEQLIPSVNIMHEERMI